MEQALTSTGEIPCFEEFAGLYQFEMEVHEPRNDNKRQAWQFSQLLKKVYIKAGYSLPLQFKLCSGHPHDLNIRAVVVYTDPDALTIPVLRCPTHILSSNSLNKGYNRYDHVLCIKNRQAVYEVDPTSDRRSVYLPYTGPQPGAEWETIVFTMMCMSSCHGGIDRRAIAIIFTLEQNCQVVGRRILKLRVCAAPKRDCDLEESKVQVNVDVKQEAQKEEASIEAAPKETTPEEGDDLGLFRVPVSTLTDYLELTKEALEYVQTHHPHQQMEIERYTAILRQHGVEVD